MRIIKLSILLSLLFSNQYLIAQIVRVKEANNIKIKPIIDKINVLLIIQTTNNNDEDYIDAQLKYYDLDFENITLHILKLADGTCKQGDTAIDFGDFKISRRDLNNFIPYKLFIPISKINEPKILEFIKSKFDSEYSKYFDSKTELKECFEIHESISTKKNKTSKIPQDFAIEIAGKKTNFGNWIIESNKLVIKLLCKKDEKIFFKQQIDSIANIMQFSEHKIDSISNLKKNSISLNIGSAKSLDNVSISLNNLIDFKINFATVYKERFQHSLGLNIGYINASNSIQLDQLFVNSNQIDKNGDIFNGNYHLTNYLENTQFKILKLGVTNTFSFKLSNTFDLSCMLNTGTLNLLNINTHVVSGIVAYTGDYPQYKLSNFNEPTLGFGNFNLSGGRNNYLNTKAVIFFFEPALQINLKLSKIFNSDALSALNFISNCSWLITEDFISNKKTLFSDSPANGFNSANNTLKKLYISNFTYSAGLSWKF